jgi:hypothetical protein
MASLSNSSQNEAYESSVQLVKTFKMVYASTAPKHMKIDSVKEYCKMGYNLNKDYNPAEAKVYGHIHNQNYAKANKAIIKFKEDKNNIMDSALFDGKVLTFGVVVDNDFSAVSNTEAVRQLGIYMRYKFDEFDTLLKFIE